MLEGPSVADGLRADPLLPRSLSRALRSSGETSCSLAPQDEAVMRMTCRRATSAFIAALAIAWLTSDVASGRQGCVTGFNPPTLSVPVSGGPVHFNVSTSSPTCQWNFGRFELPGGTGY